MSDVLEIRVKKSHIAILSVVVLVASASAAVNVRDPMNVFGDLNMQGNKVVNATEYRFTSSFVREYDENNNGQIEIEELGDAGQDFTSTPQELSLQKLQILGEYFVSDKQISRGVKAAALSEDGKIIANGAYTGTKNGPTQAGNFTFSSDINLQGNNIYNAANINTGTGGGGGLTIPPYNDISSSRQLVSPTDSGPTYTNNHNGPRLVTVITQSGNPGGRADAFVNGNLVASFGSDESASEGFQTLSFFVPQGANYQVNNMQGFLTLEAWYEQDLQGGGGGGGGGLGDGTGLEWYKSSTTNEDYSDDKTFSFGCPSGENLVAYHGATAHSGQEDTPPPWYGSWLGPIDTSGNIDYGHPGRVNNHIAGRVTAINSSDTDSLSVSIQMDPPRPGESATFATINVGCLPGQ